MEVREQLAGIDSLIPPRRPWAWQVGQHSKNLCLPIPAQDRGNPTEKLNTGKQGCVRKRYQRKSLGVITLNKRSRKGTRGENQVSSLY